MKYRIKEIKGEHHSVYYPQYKWLLFWHCYNIDVFTGVTFVKIVASFPTLGESRRWLEEKTTKPPKPIIKIYEFKNGNNNLHNSCTC